MPIVVVPHDAPDDDDGPLIAGYATKKTGALAPLISFEKYKARRRSFRSPPVEDDYVPELGPNEVLSRRIRKTRPKLRVVGKTAQQSALK